MPNTFETLAEMFLSGLATQHLTRLTSFFVVHTDFCCKQDSDMTVNLITRLCQKKCQRKYKVFGLFTGRIHANKPETSFASQTFRNVRHCGSLTNSSLNEMCSSFFNQRLWNARDICFGNPQNQHPPKIKSNTILLFQYANLHSH